jgi:hypothetical protein
MASPVYWTDWTGAGEGSNVYGKLTIGSTTVDVTFVGSYYNFQLNGGTNYWTNPAIYQSAIVPNAPSTPDIIELNNGGSKTITFSQPVQNPLIALVSWNNNTVNFNVPIEVLSYGCGYWGCGSPIVNSTNTGFYGNGELHGVVELPGTYTSITFVDTSEYWHGFTIGVMDLGQASAVPEPTSLILLGSGLAVLGLTTYRRKK